jgi:hypothetical protein
MVNGQWSLLELSAAVERLREALVLLPQLPTHGRVSGARRWQSEERRTRRENPPRNSAYWEGNSEGASEQTFCRATSLSSSTFLIRLLSYGKQGFHVGRPTRRGVPIGVEWGEIGGGRATQQEVRQGLDAMAELGSARSGRLSESGAGCRSEV